MCCKHCVFVRMYNISLENVNESERDCVATAAAAAAEQNCVVKQTVLFHVFVSIKLPSKLIVQQGNEWCRTLFLIHTHTYTLVDWLLFAPICLMMNAYEQNCNNCQLPHHLSIYGCLIRTRKDLAENLLSFFFFSSFHSILSSCSIDGSEDIFLPNNLHTWGCMRDGSNGISNYTVIVASNILSKFHLETFKKCQP